MPDPGKVAEAARRLLAVLDDREVHLDDMVMGTKKWADWLGALGDAKRKAMEELRDALDDGP